MALTWSLDGSTLTACLGENLDDIDRTVALVGKETERWAPGFGSFGLLLGLREALTNAVVHGNHSDPAKTVLCVVKFDHSSVVMEISDQGEGFDWKNSPDSFPDPTVPGHRGLGIMRTFFDTCRYNEEGNKILLTKHFL